MTSDSGRSQAQVDYSTILQATPRLDPAWTQRGSVLLDNLTKPLGSLGRLEEIAARLVTIRKDEHPGCSNKVIYTLAADHGVVARSATR